MSVICTYTHDTTTKKRRNKETEKIKETKSYFIIFFLYTYIQSQNKFEKQKWLKKPKHSHSPLISLS